MPTFLADIFTFVTGPLLIITLLGTGLFLTVRMKLVQVRSFNEGIKVTRGHYDDPEHEGEVSHFRALCSALSATIGVGNIAGVAAAIALGGPGAIFWMWVTAFFGMTIKFTECTLAQIFRVIHKDGSISGGPMYYIEKGLGKKFKPLAILFSLFTIIASFGIGNMVQANQVAQSLQKAFNVPPIVTGIVLVLLVGAVIVGGIKRIGNVARFLVPFMSLIYVAGALLILILKADQIIPSIILIVKSAFVPSAVGGGMVGGVFLLTIRAGVARGLFSNESGLGSAPIIHAAAKTNVPIREGLVAMLGPFIDTIVICTMTALVIIATGAWKTGLVDAPLTAHAFEMGFSGGHYIVVFGITLFAFSTAISWSYYGDRAAEYLFGNRAIMPYRVIYSAILLLGALASSTMGWIQTIWGYADTANLLMAFPNLLALWLLSGVVARQLKKYIENPHAAPEFKEEHWGGF